MGSEVAIMGQPAVPTFAFNEVEKIATAIARGGLFGSKDPYAVLTLCMLAQAEGQHPAVVFRDYDLIQGKPAKKAEAMLRDFIHSGGKVVWNKLDDECADATFSHPQGGTVTINWTMARAQKAQLGGKDMWKKYPRQMLRSRTISEGVRTIYPGATSGLYVPEEVRDFDGTTANDTPATPQPKRARDLTAIDAPKGDPKRAKAEEWLAWLKDELAGTDVDGAKEIFATPDTVKNLASIKKAFPDIYEEAAQFMPSAEPEEPTEQPAQVNDTASQDPFGLDDEPHPGTAIADKLIDDMDNAIVEAALDDLLATNADNIKAMEDPDSARVMLAASKRRDAIHAAKAKVGSKETLV